MYVCIGVLAGLYNPLQYDWCRAVILLYDKSARDPPLRV
jgi:hypothetical protein